jgi:hypothetical protein
LVYAAAACLETPEIAMEIIEHRPAAERPSGRAAVRLARHATGETLINGQIQAAPDRLQRFALSQAGT